MRYCLNLLGFGLIMASTAIYFSSDRQKALAIGCDTYYRVTGQIAGCTDVSTENAQDAWLEKYSICLQLQLTEAMEIYKGKLSTYYAEWDSEDLERNSFDNSFFSELDTSSPSLSTTYRGNTDFCDR